MAVQLPPPSNSGDLRFDPGKTKKSAKKILVILLLLLLIGGSGAGAWYWQQQTVNSQRDQIANLEQDKKDLETKQQVQTSEDDQNAGDRQLIVEEAQAVTECATGSEVDVDSAENIKIYQQFAMVKVSCVQLSGASPGSQTLFKKYGVGWRKIGSTQNVCVSNELEGIITEEAVRQLLATPASEPAFCSNA